MFPLSLLLCSCVGASSCGTTCYAGVWNGSGAAIGVSNNSCPLAKANGAIAVSLSNISPSASTLSASSPSPRAVQHIFLTLRAIQANANAVEAEAASGWQDLAPGLAEHPIQLDLLALGETGSRPGSLAFAMPPATVNADEYRQIRFQLLPAEPVPTDAIPESNGCGNAGWNCIVFGDGSVWAFAASESEFRFLPASSDKVLFRVLPDALTSVSFQLDPESLVAVRSAGAVRLLSAFKVSFDFRIPHE
jgi:hypothetical protein